MDLDLFVAAASESDGALGEVLGEALGVDAGCASGEVELGLAAPGDVVSGGLAADGGLAGAALLEFAGSVAAGSVDGFEPVAAAVLAAPG